MIDLSREFDQRVSRRLSDEEIIWLTTTDSQGVPQPRPVWFLWDGETILLFSQPQAYKVAHIQENSRVALNLNSTFTGGDVVVLIGQAEFIDGPVPSEEMEAYLEKYARGLERINMTEKELKDSHIAIRIRPLQFRDY